MLLPRLLPPPRFANWFIALLGFLALTAPTAFAQLNATFTSATEVPVTAGSYTATGEVNLTLGFTPAPGTTLTVVKNTGLPFINGQFGNLAQGQAVDLTFDGKTYSFIANYYGGSGNDLVLQWADTGVIAWGRNNSGQTTVPTAAQSGVIAIAAGQEHTVVLKSDGSVIAWGDNSSGQTTVPGAAQSGVVAIAAGVGHTVALKSNGSVIVWGSNGYGQTAVPTAAQSDVIAIASGGYHTVALKSNGNVIAWGRNDHGQTAVPTAALNGVITIASGRHDCLALKSDGSVIAWGWNLYDLGNVPSAAQSGVIAIAAAFVHALALKSDGSLIAWGSDYSNGQIVPPSETPSGAIAIAAGLDHAVALKGDGSVIAWGDNDFGQTTVPSDALSGASAVAAGRDHTVAMIQITPNSATTDISLTNSIVVENNLFVGTLSATDLDAGQTHTFTFAPGGADNANFTIDGTSLKFISTADFEKQSTHSILLRATDNHSSASSFVKAFTITVLNVNEAPSFTMGEYRNHSDSATTAHSVTGWVTGLDDGDSSVEQSLTLNVSNNNPALFAVQPSISADGTLTYTLSGISGFAKVSVSLTDDGSIGGTDALTTGKTFYISVNTLNFIFTSDSDAQIIPSAYKAAGLSVNLTLGYAPVPGTTLTVVKNTGLAFIDGQFNNLDQGQAVSLTFAGKTYPFVANYFGGSGNDLVLQWAETRTIVWGSYFYDRTTVPVAAQSGVIAVAGGYDHIVALKGNGSMIPWGSNHDGQALIPAAAQSGVIAIAAGGFHTVALKSDGSVIAWGYNDSGQTTIPVAAQSGVVAIAAGGFFTVALKSDGSVIAWGANFDGQATVPVAAQSGVIAIAAGQHHTVALKNDGGVIAWGSNSSRQTTVPGAAQSGVIAIAAGSSHTVALKSDGSVIAWGWNGHGQTTVPGAAQSGVIAIAAGIAHTVALKSDGGVIAWGKNSLGQTNVPAYAQNGVIAVAAAEDITMAIVRVNSPPTDITLNSSSVVENNTIGFTVGTLSAADPDDGQDHTFSFAPDGEDNASFAIDGTSLKLSTATNFETKSSYRIVLRVTDNGIPTGSYDKAFTINVARQLSPLGMQVAPLGTNLGPVPAGQLPAASAPPLDVLFEVSGVSGVMKTVTPRFSFSPAHSSLGNLTIELISPGGTTAWLHAPSLVRENNLVGPYTIADDATASLQNASTGLGTNDILTVGNYRAANGETLVPLNLTFAGTNPNGTWRLRFRNLQPGDTGTVSQASLTLSTANPGKPAIAQASPGTFQIAVAALDPSAPYLLQGSSNLTTWTTLQTFTSTDTGTANPTDTVERGQNYFYRIVPTVIVAE